VWRYVTRKLLLAIPLLFCVVTLIFVLIELSPGDAADKFFSPDTPPEVRQNIVAKYHLDEPALVRYLALLRNLVAFDFGRSIGQERPVVDIVAEALPNTLLLSAVTLLVIYPTGIIVGTIQAIRQNRPVDTAASVVSLALYSMPDFWLAMLLQLLVSFYLRDFIDLPSSGIVDPVRYDFMSAPEQLVDRAKHLVLPGIAMGLASAGGTARYVRSSMLEIIRQDYVRTARAKGLRERTVIVRHALRNALLPVVTLMGLSVPYLFSGAVIVESVFAWPGMGRLIVQAIYTQDTPLVIGCFYVFTLLVVAGNLLADVAYAWIDPRISFD